MFSVFLWLPLFCLCGLSLKPGFLSPPVESLWAACNWTALRLLFEMVVKKKGDICPAGFCLALQWACVNWYSRSITVFIVFLSFDLVKLYLYSTPLQITKCFKTFLNCLEYDFIYFAPCQNCCSFFFFFCLFFCADLPSMATCILTSMRDLYSVTLHFPFSPQWESDLGHATCLSLISALFSDYRS